MNEHLTTSTEVAASAKHEPQVLSPNVTMVLLTWISFFLLLAILYKFAWKPILAALDKRESDIRKSVEEAQRIKEELAKVEASRQKILDEAHARAKEVIDSSSKAAADAARAIQQKAKEESKIMLENAVREIKEEKERAQTQLRQESAKIAVSLAEKLIHANLDQQKSSKLIDDYIKTL